MTTVISSGQTVHITSQVSFSGYEVKSGGAVEVDGGGILLLSGATLDNGASVLLSSGGVASNLTAAGPATTISVLSGATVSGETLSGAVEMVAGDVDSAVLTWDTAGGAFGNGSETIVQGGVDGLVWRPVRRRDRTRRL
jgi:hypothetical protein